jgi:two-component system sensor histidine kinase CiaH
MLKTLKRKFILINMALVFAVMTAVLLAGLTANQVQFRTEYQFALQRELSLDAALAPRDFFRMVLTRRNDRESPAKLAFTAFRGSDGTWTVVAPWVQVEKDALASLCQRALSERAPSGFWEDTGIAYARQDDRIAFVNLQNEYSQLESGRLAWILIYLGALSVFLLVTLLFARWAMRPVESSWTQQRRFVSDASHELKTPLTVILANLDILEEEKGSNPWLTAARGEGLHMKKLIQHLLFLAHSDEARQKVRRERVPLSDIVSETALAFEALAYENSLKLNTSVAPGLSAQGDAELLRQLTGILLDNAVKYTLAGGEIDISLSRQRDKLSLTVRNSKAFIPPDQLKRLFDRFYRLDESRGGAEGGYGLGLAIASEIARRHGGTLKAASSEELGTSFTLTLAAAEGGEA